MKSYTVQLRNLQTIYIFSDPYNSRIRFFDDYDFISTFDISDIVKLKDTLKNSKRWVDIDELNKFREHLYMKSLTKVYSKFKLDEGHKFIGIWEESEFLSKNIQERLSYISECIYGIDNMETQDKYHMLLTTLTNYDTLSYDSINYNFSMLIEMIYTDILVYNEDTSMKSLFMYIDNIELLYDMIMMSRLSTVDILTFMDGSNMRLYDSMDKSMSLHYNDIFSEKSEIYKLEHINIREKLILLPNEE